MNLKALIEKRNAKIEEIENLLKIADTETRALTEEELKKFDELKSEIESLTKTVTAIQQANALSVEDDEKSKDDKNEEAETRAFANYIRGVVSENRAETTLTMSDNGAVIPSSIANRIIKRINEICPIYQLATKYNIAGTLSLPYYDEETNSITVAYANEFTELTSSAGKFKSIELKGFLAGALSKISKSLVNNSSFDIVGFIVEDMATAFSKWIENELLNGTADKIDGLNGVTHTITSKSAAAITADELMDLQEEVPDALQKNAVWIMSKKTRKAIRKLKDGDGNYLLDKDFNAKWGYTLLGKDVYVSENMPEMSAGATAIYYGDMSGLAVKISEDISIEVLREKFATQHAIGVVGWFEIDSKVENPQKIAKLVMKSGT